MRWAELYQEETEKPLVQVITDKKSELVTEANCQKVLSGKLEPLPA